MRVTKISVSRGATINLGSYESARLDLGFEVEIGAGEDVDNVLTDIDDSLCRRLRERVEGIQQEAGLPPNPGCRFTG